LQAGSLHAESGKMLDVQIRSHDSRLFLREICRPI
jgi:hypothetical protein